MVLDRPPGAGLTEGDPEDDVECIAVSKRNTAKGTFDPATGTIGFDLPWDSFADPGEVREKDPGGREIGLFTIEGTLATRDGPSEYQINILLTECEEDCFRPLEPREPAENS